MLGFFGGGSLSQKSTQSSQLHVKVDMAVVESQKYLKFCFPKRSVLFTTMSNLELAKNPTKTNQNQKHKRKDPTKKTTLL